MLKSELDALCLEGLSLWDGMMKYDGKRFMDVSFSGTTVEHR